MSDSSDSDVENSNGIDQEIEMAWEEGCASVIPEKSKDRYQNTYQIFKKWCEAKNAPMEEKTVLAYMVQRCSNLKSPGSLWAEYSMLKATIFLHEGIDISKFATLIGFLKRKNVGYRPKKANVFTRDDFHRFLTEAPDDEYLIHKVDIT